MYENNNNNPGGSVPDHRLEEMAEKLRQSEDRINQLSQQVNYYAGALQQVQQTGKPPEDPNAPQFDPQVEQAIQARIKQAVEPLQSTFKQQIGLLYDQNDELQYRLKYGGNEKFKRYDQKVDEVRRRAQANNQYISREQALQMVYFEDQGKKPAEAPAHQNNQQTNEPVWSPYYQTMVDPTTGKPVQEVPGVEQGQSTQPNPQGFNEYGGQQDFQQAQQAGQQPQQMQQPGGQQQPPQQGQAPAYGQVQSQDFIPGVPGSQGQLKPQLPGQAPNGQAAMPRGPQHLNINLEASDEDLDAWAEKNADVMF